MGFGLIATLAGVGVATGIASSVMTAMGKGEVAKIGTLGVELILWGAVVALLANDMAQAVTRIGALGGLMGGL